MPLTDLIHYFNSTSSLGDSALYSENNGVAAWYDGMHLRSLFQPIVDLQNGQVVGHQAFLAATTQDGTPLSAEEAYATSDSEEAVVYFDRLCRTLHALNFLAQRQHTGGFLQLSVHSRHLLAVPSKHGLVFEAVLKRCGLAPDDLVLELSNSRDLDDWHLADAIRSYRQRGYQIAISGRGKHSELFAPDIIKLPLNDLGELFLTSPTRIHADCISSEDELVLARELGANLAQGPLLGQVQSACVSTHRPR